MRVSVKLVGCDCHQSYVGKSSRSNASSLEYGIFILKLHDVSLRSTLGREVNVIETSE